MRKFLESIRPLNTSFESNEIAYAVLSLAADELGYATGVVEY